MSYSYSEQLQLLKGIVLAEGQTRTTDCPFCGGKSKFSISKTLDGVTVWNCYRASCPIKGSYRGRRSPQSLRRAMEKPVQGQVVNHRATPLPSITKSFRNDPTALQYVIDNNCLEAFEANYIKIRYAPAEKRVMFYTATGEGAVGRSMVNARAKWWSYGDTKGGIHIGRGDTAVLVEDVASACSVSRLDNYVGVALLGTNITEQIRNTLKRYNNLFLVLDNDASVKAVTLTKSLTTAVKVKLTKRDLKYLNKEELERLLV